jgi:hypothetical protein
MIVLTGECAVIRIWSIEELRLLSNRFLISIDSLLSTNDADIQFQPFILGAKDEGFENWLKFRIVEIQRLNSSASKELIMVARDLPVYNYFDFPELAAFKLFFWKKCCFISRSIMIKK